MENSENRGKNQVGLIRLHQKTTNPGFSFGFMKEYPKLVEMVPVCMLSAVAGAWAYVIGKKGRVLEKTALTLVLAGGASNLYDRLKRRMMWWTISASSGRN